MKKILFFILLFFPLVAFAYTSPGRPSGFVNDFAEILSQSAKADLESVLSSYNSQTGIEIAVVTIPKLVDETIETYAFKLFEDWGIGQKGKDNGVLFLISVEDREMRIEVGYGLEGDLTDVESKIITSSKVPPYFQEENYDDGIKAGVFGIIEGIGAQADLGDFSPPQATKSIEWGDFFWVFIFVFFWLGSFLAKTKSWWLGGVIGCVLGVILGLFGKGWTFLPFLVIFGFVFDYLVSTKFRHVFVGEGKHSIWPWIFLLGGRGRSGRGGRGGFGGFGGGMSGGGGASGRW